MERKNIRKKGFTLLELLIVIAIISLLVGIAIPSFFSAQERAKTAVDMASIRTLNSVTATYKYTYGKMGADIFEGFSTDELRMGELVHARLLQEPILPQQDVEFRWRVPAQTWAVYSDGYLAFGNTFTEIYTGIAERMEDKYYATESWLSGWQESRYTDIGLDPTVWGQPFDHAIYDPRESRIQVTPEAGYRFDFNLLSGEEKKIVNSGWALMYDVPNNMWYFHSIKPDNEIKIETLKITKKQN